MQAAAWGVPVIATAVAAPAAAASASRDVDLYLEAPQFGDTLAFYSLDYGISYDWGSFTAFHISNSGTEDAPAGTIVQIMYDPRVFAYPEAPFMRLGDAEHTFPYAVADTSASAAMMTLTIDVPIPAQTSWESANSILVRTNQTFLLSYPDDVIDDPTTYSEVVSNTADANAGNNTRGPYSPTVHDSGPYEFSLAADTETLSTTSCDMTVPQAIRVTNDGYGTPGGHFPVIQLNVDRTAVTDVSVATATVGGAALSNVTVIAPTDTSSSWWITAGDPIPVGETCEVTLDYTVDSNAGLDPFDQGHANVLARITNGKAPSSYDFWAYRGSFPILTYENGQCRL